MPRAMTRSKMFAAFLGIALGGSAAIVAIFPDVWSAGGPALRAVSIVHLMPVVLATLYVQGPLLRQPVLKPLGLSLKLNPWWVVAWLSPLLVLAVAVLFAWVAFGVEPVLDAATYVAKKRALIPVDQLAAFDEQVAESPPPNPLWFVLQGLPVGITLNLLLALATEIGWRGFLFREVQGDFWRRSFLIGLAEAAWFVPAAGLGFHYPDHPLAGAGMALAFCFVVSPVLVYLRVRTGSVVACAAFRGTMLALGSIASELTFDATDLVRPFHGAGGILGLGVVLALFLAHDRFVASRKLVFAPSSTATPDR